MTDLSSSTGESSSDVPRYRAAHAETEAERQALPKELLMQVNTEVPSAVILVLGQLDDIRALRPRIAEELPKFDLVRYDKLEKYLLALGHAHTLYMAASAPPEELPALMAEAARTREVFLSDVQALVTRKLVNGARLKQLNNTTGYRHTAYDVFLLSEILRENWPVIQGKTAITLGELNQAEALADRLSGALSERDQTAQSYSFAQDNWVRAFTLFVRAYNDVRRAAQFLEPDLFEAITPPIYIPRGPAKKKADEPAVTPPATTAPTNQPPATTPQLPTPPTTQIAPGLPGADPFIRAAG